MAEGKSRSPVVVLTLIAALATVLTTSTVFAAYAANKANDLKGETEFTDLDIKGYGFSGKKAYIEVYGKAGATHGDDVPYPDDDGHGTAIAYVIAIKTDAGQTQTWAIDSHEAQHSDTGVGVDWHGHRVHLGDNPDTSETEPGNCVNEVDEVVHASMKNKKAIFEDMKVRGEIGELETVNAVEILGAQTVLLDVEVADPDHPGDAQCIALVAQSFDAAS
jgi:hypothetical protein